MGLLRTAMSCVETLGALTKNEHVIIHLEAELIHASIGREAGSQGLVVGVHLTTHSLKVLALHQHLAICRHLQAFTSAPDNACDPSTRERSLRVSLHLQAVPGDHECAW